jgi:hypothetical protein
MVSRAIFVIAALLAFHVGNAGAQLYKCVGKDGKVAYQGEPCPPSVDEQTVRAPAGGDAAAIPPAAAPGASVPSGGAKEGWKPEQSSAVKNECSNQAFENAKKAWGEGPRPFPESETRDTVDKYCTCLVGRITSTITPAKYLQNRFDSVARFTGDCKMEIPLQ